MKTNRAITTCCCALAVFSLVGTAGAASLTNWVSAAVAPGSGSGTENDPYGSLYFAITNLNRKTGTADVVMLKSGTYDLSKCYPSGVEVTTVQNRDTVPKPDDGVDRSLTIRSETGRPEDVTIDCAQMSFLHVVNGLSVNLRGLTVKDAYTSTRGAAAVYYDRFGTTKGVISDCFFTNALSVYPAAQTYQGGALVLAYNSVVEGCRFIDCVASNDTGSAHGGAIAMQADNVTIRNSLFRDCRVHGVTQNGVVGGAIYNVGSNLQISNCVFDTCSATMKGTAYYARGGAIRDDYPVVLSCYFTNCCTIAADSTYGCDGGAICGSAAVNRRGRVCDSTFVGCRAKHSYGAHLLIDAENCYYEDNTAASYGVTGNGSLRSCLVYHNNSKNGIVYGNMGNESPSYVISNCVFDGNYAYNTGVIYFDGWKVTTNQVVDCLFKTNTVHNSGVIAIRTSTDDPAHGIVIRNCLLDSRESAPFVFAYKPNQRFSIAFENCSIFRNEDTSNPIMGEHCYQYGTTTLRNSLCSNLNANYMLASVYATAGLVTNSVFSNGTNVNLDPQYGNQVVSLADMKLDEGYRPTKNSPLVDAGAPVDWCAKTTPKDGPWDLGDGTYTAKPMRTISLFGKSYDVGVNLKFNNRNRRLYGQAIDVGSGEYRQKGAVVLVR